MKKRQILIQNEGNIVDENENEKIEINENVFKITNFESQTQYT